MRIIDTVVLVSSNDPTHRLHSRARLHLLSLRSSNDVFVPTIVLTEYNVVLKSRGFSPSDRERIFRNLQLVIPYQKVVPCTPSIHARAVQFEGFGGWFDSVVAATAFEYYATVISTDHVFDVINVPRTW